MESSGGTPPINSNFLFLEILCPIIPDRDLSATVADKVRGSKTLASVEKPPKKDERVR